METFVMLVEVLAGIVFVVCAALGYAAMNKRTLHCFRIVYGVIGLAGLALALDPLFAADVAGVARTVLLIGLAAYMALDRHRIRPRRIEDPAPKPAADPEATVPQGLHA